MHSIPQPPQAPVNTYTRPQVASICSMSLRKLDGHIADQSIGYIKVGAKVIFRDIDISAFLARHAIPARENCGAI